MKRWDVLGATKNNTDATAVEDILQIILRNRGLENEKDIANFINPKLENVTSTAVNIDTSQLQNTLKRLQRAIEKKEQIVIYGDYDVDGITATAILWETLHSLGASVMPYIPHRIDEGYGLSIKGIDNVLIQHPETKIIITVDNGIVAHDAVTYINTKNIDVIITDHHVAIDTLPNAFAVVHSTAICGAGVAYILSNELKKLFRKENGEDDLLELATLGTIADLVPLVGANRAIVKHGLPRLSKTTRLGLLALYEEAGCGNKELGVYDVGHIIAPRLNATGRMTSAMESLRLLCTKDRSRAQTLAALLGTTNRERQQVLLDATKHATLSVQGRDELKNLLIVTHESYPEGVVGLIASRLVEEYYRPAIVISKGEKYSKGSVRSIKGFNVIEFLRQSSDLFVNLGGHPMAAAFTIETEKIEEMQKHFEEFAHSVLNEETMTRIVRIDCELPLTAVTDNLYNALQALSPFGMANSEPTFVTKNVRVDNMKILGKDGKHLRLTISQPGAVMEAIAFGMGERADEMQIGSTIDVAYTIDENVWNGNRKLQVKVKDIKPFTD